MVKKQSTTRRNEQLNSRRKSTFQYNIMNSNGIKVPVCKTFFLSTLGFKPNNDTAVMNCLSEIKDHRPVAFIDKRGKHEPRHKIDHSLIQRHIKLYNPECPHYRREHAPLRR